MWSVFKRTFHAVWHRGKCHHERGTLVMQRVGTIATVSPTWEYYPCRAEGRHHGNSVTNGVAPCARPCRGPGARPPPPNQAGSEDMPHVSTSHMYPTSFVPPLSPMVPSSITRVRNDNCWAKKPPYPHKMSMKPVIFTILLTSSPVIAVSSKAQTHGRE